MFMGSVPSEMRSIVHEYARGWPAQADVYVGCSGNLTLERTLFGQGFALHGNDVNIYSCALGEFFTHGRVSHTLKPESQEALEWMLPTLDGGAGTMAALMLGTRFLHWVGRPGAYFERMIDATRDQWPKMHGKTAAKLEASPLRLASFYAGDVREFLADIPGDNPVVMFPPFFTGDYEGMFKGLSDHFDWPEPSYPDLDEDGKDELISMIVDRSHWIIGLHHERGELKQFLKGLVQTTNRGVPIYVYTSAATARIVAPRQVCAPLRIPKIGPEDDIGEVMRIHEISLEQFSQMRSQFMSKTIKPGAPPLVFAVSVDHKIIGAFAFKPDTYVIDATYLMSDFPVSWSKYRRLSKLIVMAAMSKESQLLVQRAVSKKIVRFSTTAFSDRPNSSKYGRGIPGVYLNRRDSPGGDGIHKYQMMYVGPVGDWTLAEALDLWRRKHAHDLKKTRALA